MPVYPSPRSSAAPVSRRAALPFEGAHADSLDLAPPRTMHTSPKILVVEDTKMAADMLCMVLNELGCASDHAEDGAEALEILCMDSDLYSLVLMDLRMPVMDGFDATRAIRKMGIELPVIAVTADEEHTYGKEKKKKNKKREKKQRRRRRKKEEEEKKKEDFAPKPLLPATLAGLLKKYINHDSP